MGIMHTGILHGLKMRMSRAKKQWSRRTHMFRMTSSTCNSLQEHFDSWSSWSIPSKLCRPLWPYGCFKTASSLNDCSSWHIGKHRSEASMLTSVFNRSFTISIYSNWSQYNTLQSSTKMNFEDCWFSSLLKRFLSLRPKNLAFTASQHPRKPQLGIECQKNMWRNLNLKADEKATSDQ